MFERKGDCAKPDGSLTLFDIDSPSKQIIRCRLDIEAGTVSDISVVVDLTSEDVFPDGMILTPDHQSLIVALYDPGDPTLVLLDSTTSSTGKLETIWTCPGSPRVTCPQLIRHQGRVRLVLTTAVEHMPPEQQARHPNAGCLFVGDTGFSEHRRPARVSSAEAPKSSEVERLSCCGIRCDDELHCQAFPINRFTASTQVAAFNLHACVVEQFLPGSPTS